MWLLVEGQEASFIMKESPRRMHSRGLLKALVMVHGSRCDPLEDQMDRR